MMPMPCEWTSQQQVSVYVQHLRSLSMRACTNTHTFEWTLENKRANAAAPIFPVFPCERGEFHHSLNSTSAGYNPIAFGRKNDGAGLAWVQFESAAWLRIIFWNMVAKSWWKIYSKVKSLDIFATSLSVRLSSSAGDFHQTIFIISKRHWYSN